MAKKLIEGVVLLITYGRGKRETFFDIVFPVLSDENNGVYYSSQRLGMKFDSGEEAVEWKNEVYGEDFPVARYDSAYIGYRKKGKGSAEA